MSTQAESFSCRRCGDEVKDEAAERRGWCKACRRSVVRRAGGLAVVPAVLVASGYIYLLDYFDLFKSTFMIIFVALGVALAYVAFKIARRVLFDVIRARTARRPAAR